MARTKSDDLLMEDDLAAAFLGGDEEIMAPVENPEPVQSSPTLCDCMDCSTPGFPVLHHLPGLAQTHVHDSVMPASPVFLNKSLARGITLLNLSG